jgi:hypothetical protein
MCTVIWGALAKTGILREDPSTWTKTRPEHLQHLKGDPAFRAVGSERTIGAIREVLQSQDLPLPKNWGALFLHFPTGGEWDVPSTGWHMDGDYTGQLAPPCGILIHAMLTDVGPRRGGTNIISGHTALSTAGSPSRTMTVNAVAQASRASLTGIVTARIAGNTAPRSEIARAQPRPMKSRRAVTVIRKIP